MGLIHIIDDDDIYRKVMVEIIQLSGFTTKDFSSGSSYLQHMKQGKYRQPQVIFSDMNMPGLSGLATLHEVLRCYPEIPCYLVTGNPTQFGRMNLSDYAIREVIDKPVCPKKIESILLSLE